MYKLLSKHGQLIAFGVGLLVLLIFFGGVISGLDGFNALPDDKKNTSDIFNLGLYGGLALIAIAVVVLVGVSLVQLLGNLKGSMTGILGFAILLVIFLAFYFTAKPDPASMNSLLSEFDISPGLSKVVSASLWTTIVMIVISLLAFVVSEIISLFR